MDDTADDLGFAFRRRKNGDVTITHHDRLAATLRGRAAEEFLAKVGALPPGAAQQLMARVTGNYKRGNERAGRGHPRNS